eukprot:356232-Chlamydomonas_euryale.AAC.6
MMFYNTTEGPMEVTKMQLTNRRRIRLQSRVRKSCWRTRAVNGHQAQQRLSLHAPKCAAADAVEVLSHEWSILAVGLPCFSQSQC